MNNKLEKEYPTTQIVVGDKAAYWKVNLVDQVVLNQSPNALQAALPALNLSEPIRTTRIAVHRDVIRSMLRKRSWGSINAGGT
jgi:hypothetical protein